MIFHFFFIKEMRKFPFYFILLGITILLGTLGLTGISIVSQEVQEKLNSRARELLTSDFAVTARRDLLPDEQKATSELLKKIPHDHYKVFDIYSMVNHPNSGQSRLVEIRATELGYPFYGKITQKAGEFNADGLVISKDLEGLWGVATGDELQIGGKSFKISGVVEEDSSLGPRGFSLAPRIYLSLKKLQGTGLLKPGSTGSFAYHYRLSGLQEKEIKLLKTSLYKAIPDPAIKVLLPEDSSQQTGRVISTLSNFMSLSALIGLVLSLVGIFYLYQSHLMARLKDLALMNLFGLSKSKIVLGIVAQFSFLFFTVFFLQIMIIVPIYRTILPGLSYNLGLELEGNLNIGALLTQTPFLYGLSVSILVPLLLGLMRTPMGDALKSAKMSMGRFRFFDFIPFLVLLWVFAWYLSNSLLIGNIFFFSLLGIFLISTMLVRGMQWALRKLISGKGLRRPSLEAALAIRNLSRSGHKLTLSFLSLVMGTALITLVLQLEQMIQKELAMDNQRPALFIFDIQEEQLESLLEFTKKKNANLEFVTPMIRARLEKVNDKKFVRQKTTMNLRSGREDDIENRERNTGLNLTYRGYLSPSEKIVEGEPFGSREGEIPLISLEKRWAQRMGIVLGDRLTFDIQGVEFSGIVHNIREVKWTSFYPNFFVSLELGPLDAAPKTFLAVMPASSETLKREIQRETVLKFPNISIIDVEELVMKISQLFDKARRAIELISLLSLGVGLVILYGLSHDQVYRRYYDLALMRTLGLSSERIRLHLVMEFGTLFLTALAVGLGLGWLMAQVIGREIFKLPFEVDWVSIGLPALSLSILCLATILIASWQAVRAGPRELLADS